MMELSGKKFKTMDIKGKPYVTVSERIKYLRFDFDGDYSIETDFQYYEKPRVWAVRAKLTLIQGETELVYTGSASEVESDDYKKVNFTSALENAETSAIGRACAMAGIGIEEGIASADEMKGVERKVATRQANEHSKKKSDEIEDEVKKAAPVMPAAPVTEENPFPITVAQKTQILLLIGNSVFTKEEKDKVSTKLGNYSNVGADNTIAYLKKVISERSKPVAA